VADETSIKNPSETTIVESTSGAVPTSGSEGSARFVEEREKIEELLQMDVASVTKTEVSASTIVKMMGLSTSSELKLIEGKLDLLSGRIGNLSIRLERVMNLLNNTPTVSDFERIESQIAALRNMFKEVMAIQGAAKIAAQSAPVAKTAAPQAPAADKATKDKVQEFLSKNQLGSAAMAAAQAEKEKDKK
jgi:hypothetical protein